MYVKSVIAGWGDMDFNAHMRNTAYLDKSGDVRMMYFSESGFPMAEFVRLKIGPVVMRDEIEYYREVNLLDEVRVTLSLAGLSGDGSRWKLQNEFFLPDGKPSAKVTSTGGWLDLSIRRLAVPPEPLLVCMQSLARTADFQAMTDRSGR
jgi:acyl-CoA thioester hydrolase